MVMGFGIANNAGGVHLYGISNSAAQLDGCVLRHALSSLGGGRAMTCDTSTVHLGGGNRSFALQSNVSTPSTPVLRP